MNVKTITPIASAVKPRLQKVLAEHLSELTEEQIRFLLGEICGQIETIEKLAAIKRSDYLKEFIKKIFPESLDIRELLSTLDNTHILLTPEIENEE